MVSIEKIITSHWIWIIARCCIAFLFLSSGLAKLIDVEGGFQEMSAAGLKPTWFFNYSSAFILTTGAYCILFNKKFGLLLLAYRYF